MVHILTTGGTIEGLDYIEDKGIKKSNLVLEDFLKKANVDFDYTINRVFKKDSRAISYDDREQIVGKIRESEAKKILITHGTFTMEETAAYIGRQELNKTVVLVGSFILGNSKNTDAPFNLGYALCALQFLKTGVYVAMNGRIFHWSNVTKNIEYNRFEPKN